MNKQKKKRLEKKTSSKKAASYKASNKKKTRKRKERRYFLRCKYPAKSIMWKSGKALVTVAACALVGAMAVGSTFAYLTDNKAATNTFTVGEVKVDLTEQNYPGNTSDDVKDLVPNEEVNEDPRVTNTGVNDALVFMTVEVPVKNVTVVKDDGTKETVTPSPTELYWFKDAADTISTHEDHFNIDYPERNPAQTGKWVRLTNKETRGTTDGSTTTYVFAYKEALAKDSKTEPLFSKVQLKNIIENEVTAGVAQDIRVKAYAIQASEVLENNTDLTDNLTEENFDKIYDIYLKQAGSETT